MNRITPSIGSLRILAGEGNYNFYKMLSAGRRWFIFAKCALITYAYSKGKPDSPPPCSVIALVKGENQSRLIKYLEQGLMGDFGCIKKIAAGSSLSGVSNFPRISSKEAIIQISALAMMLITGKRRYLNIYFFHFSEAIKRAILNSNLKNTKTVICFNDQPYDVAAIIKSFNEQGLARTIVIQHGLILNEKFYFPTVAQEFWAWGELSREFYRAWNTNSRIEIRGRYQEDARLKADKPLIPEDIDCLKVLLAPSFHHSEVKELVQRSISLLPAGAKVAIKFHPATKMRRLLALRCKRAAPHVAFEYSSMEEAASVYDVLVTKNSTSAIDFLLRGKPVAFLELRADSRFPSTDYGLDISDLSTISEMRNAMATKNAQRLRFIRESLNV